MQLKYLRREVLNEKAKNKQNYCKNKNNNKYFGRKKCNAFNKLECSPNKKQRNKRI